MLKKCQLSWWHLSRQHICPGDIFPYPISQLLLVRFWSNFSNPFFWGLWFLRTNMFLDKTSFEQTFLDPKLFRSKNFVGPQIFFLTRCQHVVWNIRKYWGPKEFFWLKIFPNPKFCLKQKFLRVFGPKMFCTKKIFCAQILLFPNYFWTYIFFT